MDLQPEGLILTGAEVPKATIVTMLGKAIMSEQIVYEILEVGNAPHVDQPIAWLEIFETAGLQATMRHLDAGELIDPDDRWVVPMDQVPAFAKFVEAAAEWAPAEDTQPISSRQMIGAWAEELAETQLPRAMVGLRDFAANAGEWARDRPAQLEALLAVVERHMSLVQADTSEADPATFNREQQRQRRRLPMLRRSQILLKLAMQLRDEGDRPLQDKS